MYSHCTHAYFIYRMFISCVRIFHNVSMFISICADVYCSKQTHAYFTYGCSVCPDPAGY